MKYSLLLILFIGFAAQAQFITNNGIRIENNSVLVTNGDWTTDAGTNLLNNGAIRTTDSFINNGTLDPASAGGFVLEYATDLDFRPGGSNFGFLVKNGAGTALVTGTLSIQDTLTLNDGVVRLLNATDTVSLHQGGVLLATDTSYIEGLVARGGTGDLLFPIGKDGNNLPLTMHKVNAQRITVSVIDAPTGYTAGPGLDSLINFPYAWRVKEHAAADTAAYVEVNYPDDLPVGANPIIAREVAGQKYASMGARFTSQTGGRVVVRSYSRRLNGVYTVANGFPADLVTDSLALIALYESTSQDEWTNNENWGVGNLDTWSGVELNGQSITAVNLPANNLVGAIPDAVVDIQALQTFNVSGNRITAIPDFSNNTEITSLNVSNNRLTFASLEPNAGVTGLEYVNQAVLGAAIDTLIQVGSPYEFKVVAGGDSSEYIWKRNGTVVTAATSPNLALASIDRTNMGEYIAEVKNPLLPDLTLVSASHNALAYANIAGQLLVDGNTAASAGKVTLLKITPQAYDTVGPLDINEDGTFSFEKTVLADYQLLGFADTITHQGVLPTYYTNTIYWEEADTIVLENNVDSLIVVSQIRPDATAGEGAITGTFEEDDGTGRVGGVMKLKRIKSAGVSARRVESAGRTEEEVLILVAYVFTDENGEFEIPNLPPGVYRLNLQYPGYPMDETSFTTITIGTALESQVIVAATVLEGKVNVRKVIVTGVIDPEGYAVDVYPNPAVDHVRLKFGAESPSRTVSILDMTGKMIHAIPATSKETQFDVHGLRAGMYLIHIREKGNVVKVLKLSIE